jgi:hypothetical protein
MTHDIDAAPHVMGEDGQFHAQDEAVDLSGTKIEAWLALGFFWLLGATVFYQFFTRYVLNDSAAWTEEIARYLLIAVVFTGASIGVARTTTSRWTSSTSSCPAHGRSDVDAGGLAARGLSSAVRWC